MKYAAKKAASKKGGAKKQQVAAPAAPAKQAARPTARSSADSISLEDARLVKELVARVGSDALKGVIDLLSR